MKFCSPFLEGDVSKISPRLGYASARSEKGGCVQKEKAAGLISVAVLQLVGTYKCNKETAVAQLLRVLPTSYEAARLRNMAEQGMNKRC